MKNKIVFLLKNPSFFIQLFTFSRLKKLVRLLLSHSLKEVSRQVIQYLRTQKQLSYNYEVSPGSTAKFDIDSLLQESAQPLNYPLTIPKYSNPLVSIVVPVYNQWDYTAKCIRSIINSVRNVSYEIILADDFSTDETLNADQMFRNLKVSRASKNQGFLLNCNLAAEQAKGKYLLFLNNDTLVFEEWLEALVNVAEEDPMVGLVGSKLIYSDGTLQEAGGIVWRNAKAWNFGNGDDPKKPEYNYVKEVDYISGASVLVRHEYWIQLGGFDSQYVPAYYEDTDLALSLSNLGYKVIYQPKSVVIHFEGKSHGTDTASGLKAYQLVNLKKFQNKWRDRLVQHHLPESECLFKARDRSLRQRTILVIDHYVPWFDQDAGSRSTFMYLKFFIDNGYSVKFLGDNFFPHQPYTQVLEQMGVEVLHGSYYANHWKDWFIENHKYIDLVYLHRPHIAPKYIDFIKRYSEAKVLYQCHDLHHWRLNRLADLKNCSTTRNDARDWERKEIEIFNQCDVGLTFSHDEKDHLEQLDLNCQIQQVPLFLYESLSPIKEISSFHDRLDCMFVGGFNHAPNKEGVLWFLNDIFPIVLKKLPEAKFHIVGSKMPDEITKFESDNVIIHGFISDSELERLYTQVKVNILPLLHGAGVKGKLVESLYFGTPIVSTSIGIEGIGESSVKGYDDSIEFANELITLLVNESSWSALLKAQKEVFTREFYLPNVKNRLLDVF